MTPYKPGQKKALVELETHTTAHLLSVELMRTAAVKTGNKELQTLVHTVFEVYMDILQELKSEVKKAKKK